MQKFAGSNFHSFYFLMQNAHTNYTKISTMRKFPAIRYDSTALSMVHSSQREQAIIVSGCFFADLFTVTVTVED